MRWHIDHSNSHRNENVSKHLNLCVVRVLVMQVNGAKIVVCTIVVCVAKTNIDAPHLMVVDETLVFEDVVVVIIVSCYVEYVRFEAMSFVSNVTNISVKIVVKTTILNLKNSPPMNSVR